MSRRDVIIYLLAQQAAAEEQKKKDTITDWNASNIAEGKKKDNAQDVKRQQVVTKTGTVDFKKTLRLRRPNDWRNILGVEI